MTCSGELETSSQSAQITQRCVFIRPSFRNQHYYFSKRIGEMQILMDTSGRSRQSAVRHLPTPTAGPPPSCDKARLFLSAGPGQRKAMQRGPENLPAPGGPDTAASTHREHRESACPLHLPTLTSAAFPQPPGRAVGTRSRVTLCPVLSQTGRTTLVSLPELHKTPGSQGLGGREREQAVCI